MTAAGITNRIRSDILAMKGYSSARSLRTSSDGKVMLDANEMPYVPLIGTRGHNRYNGQQPAKLVAALADFYGVNASRLLVGRGVDEMIDVLTRLFCAPGGDSIIVCPPTFPMYAMAAQWNGTAVYKVALKTDFTVDVPAVLAAVRDDTKLLYLCSPNNPTGNSVAESVVIELCETLKGKALVVVDEAYVEFSTKPSALSLLPRFDNLVVLRTLSKSMALAGVRCGVMMAHEAIIEQSRKILAPYPLSVPAVDVVLQVLTPSNCARLEAKRAEILATKEWFVQQLTSLPFFEKIFPSDANFVLVRVKDANKLYERCLAGGFVIRNQSHQPGLANCLRFSIGTREQMEDLLQVMRTGKRLVRGAERIGHVTRRTNETAIDVSVDLNASEPVCVQSGIGFFDHMLEQIAKHGGFSLKLEAAGDLNVDTHHTIEDCGIALGEALRQALGDKTGIERYGFTLPMDESLAQVALDLSGRAHFKFEGTFPDRSIGEIPTEMAPHFFRSLAENMHATLHMKVEGENSHHRIEACFKAFGRALRQAIQQTSNSLPSTKGAL